MVDKHDDRVTCSNCQKRVVPRLSFENGAPAKSWCPMCGAMVKDFYAGWEFGAVLIILVGLAVFYFWK